MDAHTLNPQAFMAYDQTLMQPTMMPQGYLQQPQVPVTTIKMEDIQSVRQPSVQHFDDSDSSQVAHPTSAPRQSSTSSTTSHQSNSTDAKPAKKRKSWGQVLPEPKTNLPPRKRAKTEDEKEQRRIERVKRNRLAAHNSRERKRQEVEALQEDKSKLEEKVKHLEAQLKYFKQMAPHITFSESEHSQQPLTPPGTDSSAASVTMNPRHAYNTSPETSPSLGSVDSPEDSFTGPSTPFDESSLNDLSDPTQHSAEMLCDLQCRLDGVSPRGLSTSTTSNPATPMPTPTLSQTLAFHTVMSSLIMVSLSQSIAQILSNTCSIFRRSATMRILSSWSRPLTSRHRSLPPHHPTTNKTRSPRLTSRSSALRGFLTALAQSLSICQPTQAQHLLLATGLATQSRASEKLVRLLNRSLKGGCGRSGTGRRRSVTDRGNDFTIPRKERKAIRRLLHQTSHQPFRDLGIDLTGDQH
jgi:transcriptional activator HAC1